MTSAELQDLSFDRVSGSLGVSTNHLKCSICYNLLWKPVACEICETPFCSVCINQWLTNNLNQCPNLCEPYIERKCPPLIAKLLAELQINCSFTPNGCQQVTSYEALEKHEKECGYQSEQCPGCQSHVLKKDFTEHENNCALMVLTCDDCKIAYKRNEVNTKHTENLCLKEQLRQLRDESKQMRRLLNRMSTQQRITFDDLPFTVEKSRFPDTYRGLIWNDIGYFNESYATKKYPRSGYVSAFNLGGNLHIAWSPGESSISAECSDETFTLISLGACAAWNDNLQLAITGYRKSTHVNTHNTTLLFGDLQFIPLQWANIDKVIFRPFGGTPHPNSGRSYSSRQFVITQVTII